MGGRGVGGGVNFRLEMAGDGGGWMGWEISAGLGLMRVGASREASTPVRGEKRVCVGIVVLWQGWVRGMYAEVVVTSRLRVVLLTSVQGVWSIEKYGSVAMIVVVIKLCTLSIMSQ